MRDARTFAVVAPVGYEFLCVMPDVTPCEARARLGRIALTLAAVDRTHSVSFGLHRHGLTKPWTR